MRHRGISQIDYFSNKGVVNGILKISKEIIDIWDLTDLKENMFEDGLGTIQIPTPFGWAIDVVTEAIIKPEFEAAIQSLKDASQNDFEIYKQKGLQASKEFAKANRLGPTLLDYKFTNISTKALTKLLKGEFLTLNDLFKFDKFQQIHTIFYREFEDERKNEYAIIDCVFISDELINLK